MATDATRKADLARIHIAKAALNLDEERYQAMLAPLGATSAGALDWRQRKKLIDGFVALGWNGKARRKARQPGQAAPAPRAKPTRPRRPTPASHVAPLCRKVRAQLISLGRRPDSYADAIAQQMFNVQFYEWCDIEQLRAIVTALVAEQTKLGADTGPTSTSRRA